jgi:Coproporphyrinogen III oxidase and related Fe-S oxidoreductases
MAGIYVHIPFCKQACNYCDFHFSTTFASYRANMIDAICLEIKQRKAYLGTSVLASVYFGGGTPSLLNAAEIDKILSTILAHFTLEKMQR